MCGRASFRGTLQGARYPHTLALDFEFQADNPAQAPRVGFYRLRGMDPSEIAARVAAGTFQLVMLDTIRQQGFIYDPAHVSDEELRCIKATARRMAVAIGGRTQLARHALPAACDALAGRGPGDR
jgi:hypothetical protein